MNRKKLSLIGLGESFGQIVIQISIDFIKSGIVSILPPSGNIF